MISKRPEDYTFEIGPMGPIGEGEALLLRINRNCPWNQCLFCPVYKGKRFTIREVDEVKRDIDAVRRVCDLLGTEVNLTEGMGKEAIETLIKSHPEIYGEYPVNVTEKHWLALQSLGHIVRWMAYGAGRVFLQDANALFMKPTDLTEVLRHLKLSFPTIHTITCYARSKTCDQRSEEELKELKDAGLSWCFVGIESGDDQVLEFMKKGAKKKEHISGGQKLMHAGINMAAFVMPGLAGKNKELAKKHICETADVLNEIRPTEVRVRSLAILEAAPLYQKWKSGEFEAPNEDQMVEELKMLIEGMHFDCTLETLQMTNVFAMKGPFSERKEILLQWIDDYQSLSREDRARFLLSRYLYDGYLACVKSWGMYDTQLKATIEEAGASLEKHSPEASEKVERAIFEIKSKGIP
jgi:radical SAM superfamily enzyme YgiQ (UPF0313 family)